MAIRSKNLQEVASINRASVKIKSKKSIKFRSNQPCICGKKSKKSIKFRSNQPCICGKKSKKSIKFRSNKPCICGKKSKNLQKSTPINRVSVAKKELI
jgi:hypothetical protein